MPDAVIDHEAPGDAAPSTDQVDLGAAADRVLLRRFQHTRDEQALAEIVTRHAPLVLGVCRRGTPTAADADDAFQAVFLVLAQSAGKIRRREALASWLYGVATRVCLRQRQQAARLPVHEPMDAPAERQDPLDELLARHDATIADEELTALPDSLRQPLVLRYLAGKSNTEAAAELGVSVTTLEGRLKRGKQRLRLRLLRRGVTLAAVAAALKGSRVAAESLPPELIGSTVELAVAGGAGVLAAAGSLPATSTPATTLALEEIAAMPVLTVSKPLVVALLAVAGATLTAVGPLAFAKGEATAEPGGVALNATVEETPAAESGAVRLAAAPKPSEPARQSVGGMENARRANPSALDDDPFSGGGDPFASGGSEDPFGDSESPSATAGDPSGSRVALQTRATVYKPVDLKQRTPGEVAIEEALRKPLIDGGLDFPEETPLEEIVDYLRAEYDIEIQIDKRALDDLGLSGQDPVEISVKNVRLESALRLLLRPLGLTHVLKDGVLFVTTKEEALATLETRVYRVGANAEGIREAITMSVASTTWSENGGGEAEAVAIGDKIVITQTYQVHTEINKLLTQLLQPETQSTTEGF